MDKCPYCNQKDVFNEYFEYPELVGGEMILKNGKFGKFYGCTNYPKCKNTNYTHGNYQKMLDAKRHVFSYPNKGE